MNGLCENCTLRGNLDACYRTECTVHESWYVKELQEYEEKSLLVIAALKEQVAEQGLEIKKLEAWKESALAVECEWDAQKITMMLGGKLGDSCRKVVSEKMPELLDENKRLRGMIARAEKILGDWCETRSMNAIDEVCEVRAILAGEVPK